MINDRDDLREALRQDLEESQFAGRRFDEDELGSIIRLHRSARKRDEPMLEDDLYL